MDWSDDGIVLSARKHGEAAAVVHLLTRAHGRHAGLVRGGTSRRQRGTLQPGNEVQATWRARLEEHLGNFTVELTNGHAARLMDDPGRLAALTSACALIEAGLAEREPHADVFEDMQAMLIGLAGEAWGQVYVEWELRLLGDLGFGLDLSSCAATGSNDDLAYVSPKSGRAVSLSAGEPYRDKLLPLPQFLIGAGEAGEGDLADGLKLTGYFLERHLLAPHERTMPDARARLAARLGRSSAGG